MWIMPFWESLFLVHCVLVLLLSMYGHIMKKNTKNKTFCYSVKCFCKNKNEAYYCLNYKATIRMMSRR